MTCDIMVNVFTVDGKEKADIELPQLFEENYRPDLIKRAVLASQSKRRQKYGSNKRAGLRTSAHYEGSRHVPSESLMMGREMSRMPREHGDTGRRMRGMKVPHAVGGRRAHPPKADKDFVKNINKKERKKAMRCAIASTANEKAVKERNHRFEIELPVIVEDKLQQVTKTSELKGVLEKLGLGDDLKRAKNKKIRSGKGKNRGRKYRVKRSVLIVVAEDEGIVKAARNIPGVDVVKTANLNIEFFAPGAHGTRLTVYTESAIDELKRCYL